MDVSTRSGVQEERESHNLCGYPFIEVMFPVRFTLVPKQYLHDNRTE